MCVVAAGNDREGVLFVKCVGYRAPEPSEPVRVKSVIPRKREGERVGGVVQLNAAVYGIFLIPQEATYDVHILERKSVLSTNQGWQLAGLDRESIGRRQLYKSLRQRAIEVAGSLVRVDVRRAESGQRVCANLDKILEEAIRFLKEKLPVAQTRERALVSRKGIVLPQSKTADHAGQVNRAERPGVEIDRIWVGRQWTRHGRCRHRSRCGWLFARRWLLGAFLGPCRAEETAKQRQSEAGTRNDAVVDLLHVTILSNPHFPLSQKPDP